MINGFNGDKAPSLNGFSMAFFQSCWNVMKNEIKEVFLEISFSSCVREES